MGSVTDVLASIFAKNPNEYLTLRRRPMIQRRHDGSGSNKSCATDIDDDDEKKSSIEKKISNTTPMMISIALSHPELVRSIMCYLDPIELQTWGSCCRATRNFCTLGLKLDRLFHKFRITKKQARRVQERGHDWNIVCASMYLALRELHKVYGPFEPHAIHLAVVGELVMDFFSRNDDLPFTIRLLEDDPDAFHDELHSLLIDVFDSSLSKNRFVLGPDHGDYFGYDSDEEEFRNEKLHKVSKYFSPQSSPAKILALEKRMPFIHIFTRENAEHTNQIGLYFRNEEHDIDNFVDDGMEETEEEEEEDSHNDDDDDSTSSSMEEENTNGNNDGRDENLFYSPQSVPIQIYSMNYQELPVFDESPKHFFKWYNGVCKYHDCSSLAKAFVQHVPLENGRGNFLGDCTQLLRSVWLKEHGIAPFDNNNDSDVLLESAIKCVAGEEARNSLLRAWSSSSTNGASEKETVNVDETTNSETGESDEEEEEVVALDIHKDITVEDLCAYIKSNHEFARGYDFDS